MGTLKAQKILKLHHRYNRFDTQLFEMLRAQAIDTARIRAASPAITAITDSSTGTSTGLNNTALPLVAPLAKYTSSAATTDKAPKAGFDTAVGKVYNGGVLAVAAWLNTLRTRLGLTTLTYTGTPTTAGTAVAQDKALTAVNGSGNTAVDYVTGAAEIAKMRNNIATIVFAANEVLAALGQDPVTENFRGAISTSYTLQASAATAAGVDGTTAATATLSDAEVDNFLTVHANLLATVVANLNNAVNLSTLPPLNCVYVG